MSESVKTKLVTMLIIICAGVLVSMILYTISFFNEMKHKVAYEYYTAQYELMKYSRDNNVDVSAELEYIENLYNEFTKTLGN